VVREFLTYRQVRSRLWSSAPLEGPEATMVADFLRAHYLPPLAGPEHHSSALADLEGQLPVGFPALAGDPAFVSLVNELVALPEADVVLRRLREGAEGGDAAPYPPLLGPWGSGAGPNPWEPAPDGEPAGMSDGLPADHGDAGADRRPAPAQERSWHDPGPESPPPLGYTPPSQPYTSQQPVSPVLDDDDPMAEVPGGYPSPVWYAPQQGSSYPPVTPETVTPETVTPETGVPPAGTPPAGAARGRRARVLVAGFPQSAGARLVQPLTEDGGDVVWADSEARAVQELAAIGNDLALLICRADFVDGRGRGFDLVRAHRDRGYSGPVIFYSPRLTPDQQDRTLELRAVVTDDLAVVIQRARDILALLVPRIATVQPSAVPPPPAAPGSAAPSGPRERPSGGRPR
jgi:hypothetical protein